MCTESTVSRGTAVRTWNFILSRISWSLFRRELRGVSIGVGPVRSTRMGPAIRHATTKLEGCDSKVRILFLLSDGRPQDHRYGRDRTERDYAIHDTHMALIEAKHKGIVPFCLTVDRYGQDYLKEMCGDIGYAAVADIETLPGTVTTLYRRLTR